MSRDYVMGLMKSLKFVAIPKAYDERPRHRPQA